MSTILFVEDEHAMRAVFGEFLRNEGYTVLEATDLAEATQACDNYSGAVDMAILDTKAGMVAANRLAGRYPRISVLYLGQGGAAEQNRGEENHRPPPVRHSYLQKPFTAETLLNCLRRLERNSHVQGSAP